jgi:hypothetical protein
MRGAALALFAAGLLLGAAVPRPVTARDGISSTGDAVSPTHLVSARLVGVPLRLALESILAGTAVRYRVEPNVPDVPVTLDLRQQPPAAALRRIFEAATRQTTGIRLDRIREADVIRFTGDPSGPTARPTADTETAPPEEVVESDYTWEKIPVRFQDATVIGLAFGATVLPIGADRSDSEQRPKVLEKLAFLERWAQLDRGTSNLLPPGIQGLMVIPADNTILARGTPEDIQDLKNEIRLVDVPQRHIAVRVTTGTLATDGQALNNAALTLSAAGTDERFTLSLVPRVNGDHTIDVVVDGTVTVAGTSLPVRTRVRLKPDRPMQVANLAAGGRQVHLSVSATLAPEDEDREL